MPVDDKAKDKGNEITVKPSPKVERHEDDKEAEPLKKADQEQVTASPLIKMIEKPNVLSPLTKSPSNQDYKELTGSDLKNSAKDSYKGSIIEPPNNAQSPQRLIEEVKVAPKEDPHEDKHATEFKDVPKDETKRSGDLGSERVLKEKPQTPPPEEEKKKEEKKEKDEKEKKEIPKWKVIQKLKLNSKIS
jgi:hypothetical protein